MNSDQKPGANRATPPGVEGNRIFPARTGKELILATKPYAVEVRWKSWWHTLSTLGLLGALLFGTFQPMPFLARLACSVLAGLVLVRMFVIYHDYQHHAILKSSPLGNCLFSLFGLFILAPSSIWKRSHDYHHHHNSKLFSASIGSFPIMTRRRFLRASKSSRFWYLFVRHPFTIGFGYVFAFAYGMCVASFRSSPRRHYDSLLALALHGAAALGILWFLGWQQLLLSVTIPFTLACGFGSYLFYAQHNFPGVTFKGKIEWSYEHAALESSSYMVMHPCLRWVTANIGYHHIHHINSQIPFYRLPEVMAAIPEFQTAKTTSLWPAEVLRCLGLKVWDPEQNKMLTFAEIFAVRALGD
ncbi:MAG: fatty acid desaturase [Verrucomicrobiota bacterium]